MPPILFLQTTEISLKRVGAHRDLRVIEELEEVRSRMEQHAPGASEVAPDPPPLSPFLDARAISTFPYIERHEESVAVFKRPDGGELEEEFPETFGVDSLRVPSAPHESLPLDVNEASLDADGGPDLPEGVKKSGISVNCGGDGHEVAGTEIDECAAQRDRVLAYPVRTEDDLAAVRVHDRERTGSTAFNERPVDHDAQDAREVGRPRRRTIQPVSYDLLNLPRAVPTLSRELPHGVSLDEPAKEPDAPAMERVRGIAPDKRSTAGSAAPSARPGDGRSPPLNILSGTPWTPFFSPYC